MRPKCYCAHIVVKVVDKSGKSRYLVCIPADAGVDILPGGMYEMANVNFAETLARNTIMTALEAMGMAAAAHDMEKAGCITAPVFVPHGSDTEAGLEVMLNQYLYQLHVGAEDNPDIYRLVSAPPAGTTLVTLRELIHLAWSDSKHFALRLAIKRYYGDVLFPKSNDIEYQAPHAFNEPCIEMELQHTLDKLLKPLVGNDSVIDVQVLTPMALGERLDGLPLKTIEGCVEIRWSDAEKYMRLSFPAPVEGVFAFKSPKNGGVNLWTWRPRLVPKPGVWKTRRIRYSRDEHLKPVQKLEVVLCLGLPGARHIDLPESKHGLPASEKVYKKAASILGDIVLSPDASDHASNNDISGVFKKYWPCVFNFQKAYGGRENELERFLQDVFEASSNSTETLYDEQDISYQRLYTYSAYLVDCVVQRILADIAGVKKAWISRIRKQIPRESAFEQAWNNLCIKSPAATQSDLQKGNFLLMFQPRNAIEVASQLASVSRYAVHGDGIKRQTAVLRQNHPSYAGYLCPAETPDSTGVGLTLHLARGVRCDVRGMLRQGAPVVDNDERSALGMGASLIPFYAHNDGARAMMGAKNLKQAMTVKAAARPMITTGMEEEPAAVARPIMELGWTPMTNGFEHPGVDLLVAYMPWYGWNSDDGIVAGTQTKKVLTYTQTESGYEPLKPGFVPQMPVFENDWQRNIAEMAFEETGLLKTGSPVFNGSILAYCCNEEEENGQPLRLRLDPGRSGILERIEYIAPPSSFFGGAIRWQITYSFPLSPGDKLMGRHGNKGVISRILEDAEMPSLPQDQRLGSYAGRKIDLILNPHGVISRMNMGQLMETQLSFLSVLGLELPENVGKAFAFSEHWVSLQQAFVDLQKQGGGAALLDAYGRIPLCLPGNGQTPPVVVGIQHFYRLDHKPVGKAAAHCKGEAPPQHNWQSLSDTSDQEEHDAYSLVTGQPVRGILTGDRPQRFGEMEMWALAAHQAEHIVHGLLQHKSLSGLWTGAESPTFEAIRAFLLAAGVEIIQEGDAFQFAWLNETTFKTMATPALNAEVWEQGVRATFVCPNCRNSVVYDMLATKKLQRTKEYMPTVADVLRHKGYGSNISMQESEILRPEEGTYKKSVCLLDGTGSTVTKLDVECTPNLVTVKFTLDDVSYTAYDQNKKGKESKEEDKEDKKKLKKDDILKIPIRCNSHKNKNLNASRPKEEVFAAPGGLADESIYGKADSRYSVFNPALSGWGYIELPEPMEHPLWKDTGNQLSCIPVLPLRFRYPRHETKAKTNDDRIEYREDLTRLYANIIKSLKVFEDANDKFSKNLKFINMERAKETMKRAKATLEQDVKELYDAIEKRVFHKKGVIRQHGLGRRAHFSGRFVIVPDPDLHWDTCCVPLAALLTWLGDALDERFNKLLYRTHTALLPGKSTEDKPEKMGSWIVRNIMNKIWASGSTDRLTTQEKDFLRDVEVAVNEYLAENSSIRVLLNRQPTLHRYNIQAFRPVAQPADRGLVLSIHPLVCAGFNADFDGDTMAIHMLTDADECAEAETMMPTHPRNLLSLASGNPTASYDQDMVLGTYLLSMDSDKRGAFLENLPDASCKECKKILEEIQDGRQILKEMALWDKKVGGQLMRHLFEKHTDNATGILGHWAKMAYSEATNQGIGFGFLELAKLSEDLAGDIQKSQEESAALGSMVNERMNGVIAKGPGGPGFGFAAMAVSGARGRDQVRQIIGARGLLAPGDVGFVQDNSAPSPFFIASNLVDGMTVEDAFYAAMNSRSSMIDKKLLTPKAGYLTRRLAMACWDWYVEDGFCGNASGSPATCYWATSERRRICASCYGIFLGYDSMDRFPAGMVAAQSIGERGTQLSMRSFHTGTREISLDGLVSLLEGKDWQEDENGGWSVRNWFETSDDAGNFVQRFKSQKPYEFIDDRHLLLLWRIIHECGGDKKALKNVWQNTRGMLSGMAGGSAKKFIAQMITDQVSMTDDSAMGRLLRNRPFVGPVNDADANMKTTDQQGA